MLGIDLVKIERAEKVLEDAEMSRRLLNESERAANAETVAGKIAAKEAYFKAVGEKLEWKSLEVVTDSMGKPSFSGKDAELSITHEDDYAAAVVLLR